VSFAAQPSRRASPALRSSDGLHSVQYSDGLHLARTIYEQRPFQGLPRSFGVACVIPHLKTMVTKHFPVSDHSAYDKHHTGFVYVDFAIDPAHVFNKIIVRRGCDIQVVNRKTTYRN
jgi:hypothetical protein